MKIVVFGLTISSSWGNGHATLWRGLCRALAHASHEVVFFEKDTPYYRSARDMWELPYAELVLYSDWDAIRARARRELESADVGMVTSYCPDGAHASELVLEAAAGTRVFYDMDTPVTLAALDSGERPAYLSPGGLGDFDLVLSFTGGRALDLLRERLGACHVAPLYGHVDPSIHRPVPPSPDYASTLSYLGTYAADRQSSVEELFLEPARAAADDRFLLGGSMYPAADAFPPNVVHYSHVAPADHATFFCSSRSTLNATRSTMASLGYCPSGRLFEAAACGVPILSDWFEGLDLFFDPKREIAVVRNRGEVLALLAQDPRELSRQAAEARARTLECHTSERRAEELVRLLTGATSRDARSSSSALPRAAMGGQ